jgi:hypothetical protein
MSSNLQEPTEAALKTKVVKYLRANGCYVIPTTGDGKRQGLPDLLVSYKGISGAAELKRKSREKAHYNAADPIERWTGRGATELQARTLNAMERDGGYLVALINDMAGAQKFLAELHSRGDLLAELHSLGDLLISKEFEEAILK